MPVVRFVADPGYTLQGCLGVAPFRSQAFATAADHSTFGRGRFSGGGNIHNAASACWSRGRDARADRRVWDFRRCGWLSMASAALVGSLDFIQAWAKAANQPDRGEGRWGYRCRSGGARSGASARGQRNSPL